MLLWCEYVVERVILQRTDLCREEDDWDGRAELLVCGYPEIYSDIQISNLEKLGDSELPCSTEFCSRNRKECVVHYGWHKILTAELAQVLSLCVCMCVCGNIA